MYEDRKTIGRADFRRQRSGFSWGHVKFEMFIKHPSGDVEDIVGFKSPEFRGSPRNKSLARDKFGGSWT